MGCGRTVSTPLFEWLRLVADDHLAPTVNGSEDHLLLIRFSSAMNLPPSSSSQINVEHKMLSRANTAGGFGSFAFKPLVLSRVDING